MFRADDREGLMNPHQQHRHHHQQQAVNPFSNSGPFFFSGHFGDTSPFDAPMHQPAVDSGGPSMGYNDAGLCQKFLRMHVADHPGSSDGSIRVDPDRFSTGFDDPVHVWGQGWNAADSVGATRFQPGMNSGGMWSPGAARQGPLMLNDVERELDLYRRQMPRQRLFVSDGPVGVLDNGDLSSLELDLLNRMEMLRAAGLRRPMIPNPVLPPLQLRLPVESEGSVILDAPGHGGKCSSCLAEMKPKRSRAKKRSGRNDQSVMMPGMFPEDDFLLDDRIARHLASGNGFRLVDFQGNIYTLCKDQLGCRFLQKILEGGSYQDVDIVFSELIDHVVELMVDPFANYVVQKLLEVCTEEHRMAVVFVVTRMPGELLNICLDTHGTRVVQKLIELIKCRQHISMIIFTLQPHLIELIKDLNGNHVVQRCLQCFSGEHTKFIYDTAARFCVDIATHQHGCCVLNRCIAYSSGRFREMLISNICSNGLLLAQDSYGNYVIQYIIELKHQPAAASLLSQFEGRFAYLSMQKFSSHVVEKCLRFIDASHPRIVKDLLSFPHLDRLIQDRFANYVVQSALELIQGSLRSKLVEAIRPHEGLRSSPYCKKIFSRNLLKK